MYWNDKIFSGVAPRFKKVSVLVDGSPWEHYENTRVFVTETYVLLIVIDTDTEILLPRESVKVIMTEGKIW